jgi:hypothetical protein
MMKISPTLKVKFSLEILIQGQMRRVRRKLWNIKHREACIWGSLLRPRDFLLLLRGSAGCLASSSYSRRGSSWFKFYLVLQRLDPNDPGMQQRFHDQATNWCQWAQDLTHQAVSEGKNRVCEAPCHCWKQAGPKELSPGVRLTS